MIDPIPVKEELDRIKREQETLRRRGNAALALGWFSAHALSKAGSGPRVTIMGVLVDELKPVAYATTDAEKTFPYLTRAFREHHRAIITRAIELAEADFAASGDA